MQSVSHLSMYLSSRISVMLRLSGAVAFPLLVPRDFNTLPVHGSPTRTCIVITIVVGNAFPFPHNLQSENEGTFCNSGGICTVRASSSRRRSKPIHSIHTRLTAQSCHRTLEHDSCTWENSHWTHQPTTDSPMRSVTSQQACQVSHAENPRSGTVLRPSS
jgi:hypothetical protein